MPYSSTFTDRLHVLLWPELHAVAPHHRKRALEQARNESLDQVEIVGILAAVVVATMLTNYGIGDLRLGDRVFAALANFAVALPLLGLIARTLSCAPSTSWSASLHRVRATLRQRAVTGRGTGRARVRSRSTGAHDASPLGNGHGPHCIGSAPQADDDRKWPNPSSRMRSDDRRERMGSCRSASARDAMSVAGVWTAGVSPRHHRPS